jgi:hypothetical protein
MRGLGVAFAVALASLLLPPFARGEEEGATSPSTPAPAVATPRPASSLDAALVSADAERAAEAERALGEASREEALEVARTLARRVRALERAIPSPAGPAVPYDPVPLEEAREASQAIDWDVRLLEMTACEAHGWFGNPPCDGRAPLRVLSDRARGRILSAAEGGRGTTLLGAAKMTGVGTHRVSFERVDARRFDGGASPLGAVEEVDATEGFRLSLRALGAVRGGRIVAEVDARDGRVTSPPSLVRTGVAQFERPEWVAAVVRRLVDLPDGGTFLLGGLGTCPGGSTTTVLVTARVVDPRPVPPPATGG